MFLPKADRTHLALTAEAAIVVFTDVRPNNKVLLLLLILLKRTLLLNILNEGKKIAA